MSLNLDDLVSLHSEGDDTVGELKAPLSPSLLQIEYSSHPNDLTSNHDSSSPPGPQPSDISFLKHEGEFTTRAVHMSHDHNNARIPNFLHPVDRSNSSSRPLYDVKSSFMNHHQGVDNFSMAEVFLSNESARRRSLEQNYENLGTLLSDRGSNDLKRRSSDNITNGDGKARRLDASQAEIEELVADVDPTPWSEIKKRIQTNQLHSHDAPIQQSAHPHHYNYYPYGRHKQLPIPEHVANSERRKLSPSQIPENKDEQSTMAQAIATAAAIASGQGGPARSISTLTSPSLKVRSSSQTPRSSNQTQVRSRSIQSAGGKSEINIRHFQRQQGSYSQLHRAAAHTTNRASVVEAASKKSQYGFGGNHTVPSVPAPPPAINRKDGSKQQTQNVPDIYRGHNISPPNSGAAYERKKQRAKDARVKLNESIDRLSIAIGLAGSQSKQRHELLSSRIKSVADPQKTLQICEECAKLAEQAKKWDRPSFVGTAASMIQELNSQCEALTRELVVLHEQLDVHLSAGFGRNRRQLATSTQKRNERPIAQSNDSDEHYTKRALSSIQPSGHKRLEGSRYRSSDHCRKIFISVKDFLDPTSMSRSLCVSRTWRDLGVFDNDDAWFNLAIKRFGFYNVRQWKEKMGDCEQKFSNMSLYQSMDASNIMPHFEKKSFSLIGEAKIPGKVSGWVFVVERSNGETHRSVRTEPGMSTPPNGSFHSRPVVKLMILIQNTGMADQPVIIQNQKISVDISTRRTGGELKEIDWDCRFQKVLRTLDGKILDSVSQQSRYNMKDDLCHLRLFDSVLIDVFIDARGCSTTSKFQQRSNFTKLLVCLEGTTVPMVIPFLRDHAP